MKMLMIENRPGISPLRDEALIRRWSCTFYAFKIPVDLKEERRFLLTVSEERPDVVIIDIALNATEERMIDDYSVASCRVPEDTFSGFKYCQALSRERWNVPVVIFTRITSGNVARAAFKTGADRVLIKRTPAGDLMDEITTLVRSRVAHDPNFYWQLNDEFAARPDMWQSARMERALDRFFLNDSIARRFSLFTASLRTVFGPFFPDAADAEKTMTLSLVKSQVLLSLVDPRLRDHVKHTGNVFWLGYRLLHDIPEFLTPATLPGVPPLLYAAPGTLSPREQVMSAWTLAALFHDYGYVDERQEQLAALFSGLLQGASFKSNDVRNESSWSKNMEALRTFVANKVGADHCLYKFVDKVFTSFGNEMPQHAKGKPAKLVDHGFLGAHRLLSLVPLAKLDAQHRDVVLHAALAIACHNYPEMVRKWQFAPECVGNLQLGHFPVCSLLAFCDAVQTWDRETEEDPSLAHTDIQQGLLERLVLSDTAYVSGSELGDCSIRPRTPNPGYDITIRIRYFVEPAKGVKEVCETLEQDITGWVHSGRLESMCAMMGISSLLHGEVVYQYPMQSGETKAPF